ncbi:Bacterial leucyl aminopeptidase [Pseudidiomarina piscicola]|uniref:Bacterial leucyl aminopeptidase n=1 Tax=Pseudidiomarina piscicola TaxID=2614830 RepID=A0A6S6WLD3_9GAMM|nr:M28 family metallopeptidase [Pseudidiomarina piscicola]CAB0150757.1 Bacterial leucyl aminopeptidase [Pseudidiomarina piscicola]VZT40262.1 Bacterial leucyl aminopeptidase [Pseudomonas aeruginosa]
MNKSVASLLALSLTLSACSKAPSETTEKAQPNAQTSSVSVSLENLHEDIKVLASDEFGGRGPLTEGETLTINYLADAYQQAGLVGAVSGDFLQPVEMAKITPDQSMKLQIGDLTFDAGSDFTARTQQIKHLVNLEDSDVVFVGYGINAPEHQWNDFADVDVEGKTLIVLVNDPGFATQDDNLFTGNAMTYYGRWTYKYEEAARQGASAVFIVHETAPAAYPWSVVESSNTGSKYALVDDTNNASQLPIMGWIDVDAAQAIFAQAGFDYAQMKEHALTPDFKAVALNSQANLKLRNELDMAKSHNVVAQLTGSEQPDEYVIISAHWDHFGTKEGADGPMVFNGAVDNATGTAATLEIARIMANMHAQEPFKRSLIFVNFTAEETGLIGSEQFANGSVVPTSQMVALLNIDGMNVLHETDYILQYGNGLSEMEDYLAAAAKAQNRTVKMDPRPQNGLFFRSDHFSLAKQGVPSLLFMSLGDTDPDYITHKYHKVTDVYAPDWPLDGMQQDIELIVDIAAQLANNGDWPKWQAESDFKTRRMEDQR